jgi:mannose-6-phosphate isomerase-like protein (cupin superfamily)
LEATTSNGRSHAVVGPGEGESTWFLRNRMEIKATADMTGGAYGLLDSVVPPGQSPPLHVHEREDEAFYVLDGEVSFRCADDVFTVGAGSFVYLPRGVPHTFIVEGDTPARVLTFVSPGTAERFFIDGGRPPEGDGLPPVGPPDFEKLGQAAQKYGMEFVGPPLEPQR